MLLTSLAEQLRLYWSTIFVSDDSPIDVADIFSGAVEILWALCQLDDSPSDVADFFSWAVETLLKYGLCVS